MLSIAATAFLDSSFKSFIYSSCSLSFRNEANPLLGRISDLSPIGSAMLGHRAGDEVLFEAPNGEAKIKILSVHRANKT